MMSETMEIPRALMEQLSLLSQRDRLVREAYAMGMSKTDIHRFTGLARTTIDRILTDAPVS